MSTTNILDLNNRIDELATSYPASKVMMSDGVTSVEDALAAHTLGTFVDISAYTSSNPYIAPSDGYVRLSLLGHATGRMFINGKVLAGSESDVSYLYFSIFVKKGMTAYMDTATNAALVFFPIQ